MEVLPAKPGPVPKTVSHRLKASLQHPNKTAYLTGVQFSPDGSQLIAGDYPGGVIQVWDVATGKQLTSIETGSGYRGSANYFFVSPDWKTIFVARGKLKLEHIEKDGKRLNDWKNEGDIRSWDLASGKLLRTWKFDPPASIMNAEFSRDRARVATMEYASGVYEHRPPLRHTLWDLASGKHQTLPADVSYVSTFAPDGRTLVANNADTDNYSTAIKLLDATSGREKVTIPMREPYSSVEVPSFSPDGRIMVGNVRSNPRKRDYSTWKSATVFWDVATGRELGRLMSPREKEGYRGVCFLPRSKVAYTTLREGTSLKLCSIDLEKYTIAKSIPLGEVPLDHRLVGGTPVASPDGRWLAVLSRTYPEKGDEALTPEDVEQPQIHLIDVRKGELKETLIAPPSFGSSLCFSSDGKTLATAGHGKVLLWEMPE